MKFKKIANCEDCALKDVCKWTWAYEEICAKLEKVQLAADTDIFSVTAGCKKYRVDYAVRRTLKSEEI